MTKEERRMAIRHFRSHGRQSEEAFAEYNEKRRARWAKWMKPDPKRMHSSPSSPLYEPKEDTP